MKPPRTQPLLIEVGCEEIPARFLMAAREDFWTAINQAMAAARLVPPGASPSLRFSTPRRLAVWFPAVLMKQGDLVDEVVGPPMRVAFDEKGKPTKAAKSFAQKNGVAVSSLTRVTTPKGEYLAVRKTIHGQTAQKLLPGLLAGAVTGLNFPKSMYWKAKTGPRFLRPIRWLLALLGEGKTARVIPFEIADVRAEAATYGHRVLGKGKVHVSGFMDYLNKLSAGGVHLDPVRRRGRVQEDLKVILKGSHSRPVADPWLVDWVVNSTEWPVGILGNFDSRFLRLPREILVTVMRDHQKYFAVEDRHGKLQPHFITFLNLDRDRKGIIREGHERVLAARFADAEFFWDSDQREFLASRQERLASVTYQAELGTYADKVSRMKSIAAEICGELERAQTFTAENSASVIRALELCKCDLTTQMVQEFTELQGIVGGLYAEAQGEPKDVCQAIYDHYRPEGPEDRSPRSRIGAVVSLADKLDSVVSGFAIGQEPTGSSDPFALRRQGNGIVKVLVEHALPLPLKVLIEHAVSCMNVEWKRPQHEVFGSLVAFFEERMKYYLESGRGLRYDTVRAVVAAGWENFTDVARRADALERIRNTENFAALSVAAKRIKNILEKSASAQDWQPGSVNPELLEAGPEEQLFEAHVAVADRARRFTEAGEYEKALETIADLRPLVDRFFDKVLVMAEDRALRENRLRLLGKLDILFSGIAHFAEIAGGPGDVDASTSQAVTSEE
ncbi:MAG: glycine--tRNA ligase subunit beta [Acidobacteria bacterium]|nr:glycine--tRNA ligase subunit beta [Acidobacteriota bacterium]